MSPDNGSLLLGLQAFDFLEREGFSVLESALAHDEGEAATIAAAIGFPVALKISSQHAIHKTEVGGVRTCLDSKHAVVAGFRQISEDFGCNYPAVKADGIIVQKHGEGFEVIIGVLDDEQFGPVVMFGLGGIFAEGLGDVSFRLIPLELGDARTMLEDLQGYQVLKNPRKAAVDLEAIADFLVAISDCAIRHPEIREMDLNPVFVSARTIEICDARIRTA
jgi:succinyl-CoA synthetase beta subunit